MKKEVVYISYFVTNLDYVNEVKERLEKLAENIGELDNLNFKGREFKTRNRRKHETFNSVLYDLLSEDKLYETKTMCF